MPDITNPVAPFSGETDDSIRERMLDAVDDSFIKLEGDIIYDMTQPAALELERLYQELETQFWQVFPQSATAANLDALAEQFTDITRATDETDDAFRLRVLAAMAQPAGAGTVPDYRRAVAGVSGIGPLGVASDGAGSLTFYVIADDHTVIAPGDARLTQVASALADNVVLGVVAYDIEPATLDTDAAFTLTLNGAASAAQLATWRTALAAWFASLAPGDSWELGTALTAAGIPLARYSAFTFGAIASPIDTPTADATYRASSITITMLG